MHILLQSIKFAWQKNQGYGERLLGDLTDEQIILQPGNGVNHPAWIMSHLNLYHPIILATLKGETFEDPKGKTYGLGSKPEPDSKQYPSREELLANWTRGHEEATAAMETFDSSTLENPTSLERWKDTMGTVGTQLGYLMQTHESLHLGQLSAWRRVQGLPSV